MGIQSAGSLHTMKFFIVAALCAVSMAAPEGRRLRPEEHWRPAQGRDLSKYKPRGAMVDANGDDLMVKINKVAAEMRAAASPSNHKDVGKPKAACGIEGPAREGRIVGGVEATEHAWPWQVALFIDDAWFCGGSIISENYVLTAAHCADGASYFDVMAGAHNVRESSEPNRVEITSYNGWTHPEWNTQDLSSDLALIELPSPMPMNDYISTSCLPAAGETPGDKWTQVGIVSFGASAGCEVGMPAGFTRTEYFLDWIKSETGMP